MFIDYLSVKPKIPKTQKFDIKKIHNWAISAVEQSGTPFFPKIEITDSINYTIFNSCFDISGDTFR